MKKIVHLLKKRPDMSAQDFKDYYETRHVPLILKHAPHMIGYSRDYILPPIALEHIEDKPPASEYDVIVQMSFEDDAAVARMERDLADPQVAAAIKASEALCLAPGGHVTFAADRRSIDTPGRPQADPLAEKLAIKLSMFFVRKPGMTREAFIDYYETGHAVLATRLAPMVARYQRNHVIPDGGPGPGFDVLTESWFRTEQDFTDLGAIMADPDIGGQFAADEENLFDRGRMLLFTVDERITPKTALAGALAH